jgi:D-glycero-alpha-D-manno-heptose-7-phosphate kinase
VLESSAPTRIDLAGGTIDIWPLYLFHDGATTVNAAISLRAHARIEPFAGGLLLRSIDTSRETQAPTWSDLSDDAGLPLLTFLARHYQLEHAALITRGESPAGAGIAGSSALTIACCGALAQWTHRSSDPEDLLNVAMNVECQTIRVPTGVQDYRPALYGGIAAIELGSAASSASASTSMPARSKNVWSSPTPASRGIPAPTTGKSSSATSTATAASSIASSGSATPPSPCATRSSEAIGTKSDGRIAAEWDNRKRLAPGVTTPEIDDLMRRAAAAGATAGKVCGAGGGGCLFCYGPPAARTGIAAALQHGGARILDFHIETEGLRIG